MGIQNTTTIRGLLVVSIIINVFLAVIAIELYYQNLNYSSNLKLMFEENEEINRKLVDLQKAYEMERSQLDYYKRQIEVCTGISSNRNITSASARGYAEINIVAVRSIAHDPFTVSYEGVVLLAEVEVRDGEGRILINTEPKIGIDLQSSLRTAVTVAENLTRSSFNKTDVILTISYTEDLEIVDGPSAGAAITMGLIAAIEGRTLRSDVYITGTINSDGTLGEVGGILEKAEACARQGATKFIVPKGQSMVSSFREVKTEPFPGLVITTYEPYQVDLSEYLNEKGYAVEIIESSDILEAYDLSTR